MADLKISQLTGATTPLAGTEVVPLVQSSTTKKVAVSDLTAGRAVSMASVNVSSSAANSAVAAVYNNDTADGNGVYVKAGGANSGKYNLVLQNAASQDLLAVYADGTVQTGIGNIKINTAAKGVNFTANTPAAGMTSQLLNWYEEGTWTPSLAFGGASTGITYSAQAGTYTRIGRLVHCFARLSLSSKGSASGSATITGLPFTSASGDASNGGVMTSSLYAGMANLTGLSGYVGASSTTINLGNDGATDTGGIYDTNFTNSTTIYFSVQYYV